ncbi:MAG: glycerol kinase GlpK [candidate division KSB1 bacterium]|nr:glycerol kinase GlpK [candidate division KSB1 bacterium]
MIKTKILAIDQSTSGTKAIIFDNRGKVVHRCTENHEQFYPRTDWVEHDPEEIYEKTKLAISKVLQQSQIDPADIAAMAIANQRETVAVWDKKSGKPIYNAIVWQCQRGAETCRILREQGYAELVETRTGLLIDPYFSATGLKWIMDHVKGVREKAKVGELAFGTMDSWLIYKLSGGSVHATDYSNACRTMLYNIYDLKWDKELLNLMGVPEHMAPEVRYADDIFAYTDIEGLLDREIPVTGVMGDSHAALFGQSCFKQGMAKATYGTGSSVMMNIGNKPLKSPEGLVTSIGFAIKGEIDYVFEGNIHCTGDTINWLVQDLELISDAKESETLAISVDDNNGVYMVPAFVGLGAPYWDNKARASISEMPRSTKKAHVVRAALEAIAYQIKDLLDLMTAQAGINLSEIRVDGGPTNNDFLMQFQSDMLDSTVAVSDVEEASALGAALAGGLGIGLWKDLDELSHLVSVKKRFESKMTDILRETLYTGWQNAVSRVRKVKEINRRKK